MDVQTAIQERKSVRAYLDKEVKIEQINRILDVARHSPSGSNIQPWRVAVVMGEVKRALQEKIEKTFRQGNRGKPDFPNYPSVWNEPYNTRRKQCGLQLYTALDINYDEKEKRLEQWIANYRAFDAPVMMLFFLDQNMQAGSFVDIGMFLQSIMLAAVDEGLATCAQNSLASYPEIIKETLSYPQSDILLCGMSLGYEDTTAKVNGFRTPRVAIEHFTQYFS